MSLILCNIFIDDALLSLSHSTVLVIQWMDGTKLTDIQRTGKSEHSINEIFALVKVVIDSKLTQLLVTGLLHADLHAGNLLKVVCEDCSIALGYLDFRILSTIPSQVRDALVCSVVLQVFSRDIGKFFNM